MGEVTLGSRKFVLALLLLMLPGLAGCGDESPGEAGADEDESAEVADDPDEGVDDPDEGVDDPDEGVDEDCEEMDEVRTAALRAFTAYPLVVAHEEGFFEAACIDHSFVEAGTGEEYRTAMLAGELEMMVGSVNGNQVLGEAIDLVTGVGVMRRSGIQLIISSDHEGTVTRDDPSTLEGLTLSVTGLEAPTHMTLEAFIEDNGVNRDTVEIVPTGGFADGLNALIDGRIDGMVIGDPLGSQAVRDGDAFLYTDFGSDPELFPRALSEPYINLAFPRNFYEDNPELAQRATRVMVDTMIAMHEDPEWTIEVAMDAFDLDEEVARTVVERHLAKYEPYVDQEEWDRFTEQEVENGTISEPQYFEDHFEEDLIAEWDRFYEAHPDFEGLSPPE